MCWATGKLAAILLIWSFFLVIFALVGVFLFAGTLYRCIVVSLKRVLKSTAHRPTVRVALISLTLTFNLYMYHILYCT